MNTIQAKLKEVYMINLKDAERLIEIAKAGHDPDLLTRAVSDQQKWREKLKRLELNHG